MLLDRTLRWGMVGGGPGAFIGAVHRRAAALTGQIELVAGAFSSSPERSHQQGRALHLDPDRVYGSFEEMAEREAARPAGERVDLVSIVVPNHLHFDACRAFVQRGFHVVCDKPMTTTLEDAEALCRLVRAQDVVFALMHNYTGYPMVRQARQMIHDGKLGTVRKIVVEYAQGWLAARAEEESKQAAWRTDPEQAGVSSVIGDIGTHAEHLARYLTGLEVEALCADLTTFVEGRSLEDDANLLMHYRGGARGVLCVSQIAAGEENNLRIRVYGTDASLAWQQEHPNSLHLRRPRAPEEVYRPGHDYLTEAAQQGTRLPPGHPEGFLEAFANIYRGAARAVAARIQGDEATGADFPTVQDGAIGVHFIHRAVESGRRRAWIDAHYTPPA